jgi:hypothetical protein
MVQPKVHSHVPHRSVPPAAAPRCNLVHEGLVDALNNLEPASCQASKVRNSALQCTYPLTCPPAKNLCKCRQHWFMVAND